MKTAGERNKGNGQFTYSSKFERMCTCGRVLGVHDGEAPHAFEDMTLDPREGLPECNGFKLARKSKDSAK